MKPNTSKIFTIDKSQQVEQSKKLRRRIEDYLRKYATDKQLTDVANLLGVKV